MRFTLTVLLPIVSCFFIAGCDAKPASQAPAAAKDEVGTERSKLSAEDRTLVEAQEWCVVNSEERLGSMGPPIKLTIKGQPVFICCSGCKKKAENDPEKTLAKFEELKAKVKADKERK